MFTKEYVYSRTCILKNMFTQEHVYWRTCTRKNMSPKNMLLRNMSPEKVSLKNTSLKNVFTKQHVPKENITSEHVSKEYVTRKHDTGGMLQVCGSVLSKIDCFCRAILCKKCTLLQTSLIRRHAVVCWMCVPVWSRCPNDRLLLVFRLARIVIWCSFLGAVLGFATRPTKLRCNFFLNHDVKYIWKLYKIKIMYENCDVTSVASKPCCLPARGSVRQNVVVSVELRDSRIGWLALWPCCLPAEDSIPQ